MGLQKSKSLLLQMESEEDGLTLSAESFAALKEFYEEQDDRDQRREELETVAANGQGPSSIDAFSEDWQLSQFWYDDNTAEALADKCAR